MEHIDLTEMIKVGAMLVVSYFTLYPLVLYPIFRWSAVRSFSKSYGIDSSRLDKRHATRIWLDLYEPPFFYPGRLPNPELEEIVKGFRDSISGVQDEELRQAALHELLQKEEVRAYLMKR